MIINPTNILTDGGSSATGQSTAAGEHRTPNSANPADPNSTFTNPQDSVARPSSLKFWEYLKTFADRKTSDPDKRHDFANGAVVRFLENGGIVNLSGIGNVDGYLYTSARNAIYNQARADGALKRRNHGDSEALKTVPGRELPPDKAASRKELEEIIKAAILKLPEKHQGLIKDHYYDGLTYAELSVKYGKPIGSVKSLLNEARNLLAKRLERYKDCA